MAIKIVRMQNREAFTRKEVLEFFQAAFRDTFLAGGDFSTAVDEFRVAVENPKVAVFVGSDDGKKLQALAFILLPTSKVTEKPQVVHFYNVGSDELRMGLVKTVLDFVRESGYMTFYAVNTTGASDRAWSKVFGGAKGQTKRVGSILEIKVI